MKELFEKFFELIDVSPKHEISVILSSFGDSAINYKVRVWIDDPWQSRAKRALLNQTIWRELKEADITLLRRCCMGYHAIHWYHNQALNYFVKTDDCFVIPSFIIA